MKDLSPAVGARWKQSGQQLRLAPAEVTAHTAAGPGNGWGRRRRAWGLARFFWDSSHLAHSKYAIHMPRITTESDPSGI